MLVLQIFQIIIAALLIVSILVQAQGAGLSTAFGGGGEMFRGRQRLEKVFVITTVFLASILGALSIILLRMA